MTISQRAKRYGRAWRIALCGPDGSTDEVPLPARSVQYRLEKAYLAGFQAGRTRQAAMQRAEDLTAKALAKVPE